MTHKVDAQAIADSAHLEQVQLVQVQLVPASDSRVNDGVHHGQ